MGKKTPEAASAPMELTLREEKSIVAQVHPPAPLCQAQLTCQRARAAKQMMVEL